MSIIERMAERIIKDAVRSHASDIHIIPRRKDTLIQLRFGSQLTPRLYLPKEECDRLISHFKFTASMDIGEKRRPQSGAYSLEVDGKMIGMRFSTLPSSHSESLVIRILPQQEQIPFLKISLFPDMTRKMLALLKHAHGLIIFTGPTGSGKTTTLYSLLNETSHMFHRNVITLEDPIEKENDLVLQVQVNEKAGVSYSAGLKAILRHDPDIIMVGEIRDAETAKIAVRAALTGHLVLSTMHTRDAQGAVYRLAEFGVNMMEIEQTLVAVTAQRLVELNCPYCEGECSPFCYGYGRWKRASVFELLAGRALNASIKKARGEISLVKYRTLKEVINKGIALGYIKETEYSRWVHDNADK
ncbi:competence type IV pilus ATPase ComGA [Cytobacillus oceanisediminis]|uniref:competence type IV pilus ATPase ComGA n=1 Tax=Cytobacillus oceanisediminis TaxID=665099 RepID=UPI001FB43BF7|nr:competence type IV pilus ATPase ComGA [Cytobacillus oceanisediminis]UOE54389.1 type II/IV secretion system protein [Cytobacillus oceanisediminis]